MRRALFFLIAVLSALPACAQFPGEELPPELKKLDWLMGTWSGSGNMTMQGMEQSFTIQMTNSWDGYFAKSVSTMDYSVIKVSETMMMGWDAKKGEYFSSAYTNMSPLPRVERGKMEGDALVMVSEPWEVMGQSFVSRATMKKVDDSTIEFVLEFKNGESWEPASKVTLKKG
jgi:hypothetical protein